MASAALEGARQLANASDPPLIAPAELAELQAMIDTLPPAALQVFRYAPLSPFSALGIARLAEARTLNTVNRRNLLKKYRRLALELHPDRNTHPLAVEAMQALNAAYERTMQPTVRQRRRRR